MMRWNDIFFGVTILIGASAAVLAQTPAPVDEVAVIAPSVPDYALASSWAAGPGGPGASAALPAGASPANPTAAVDVFYVHPTTLKSDQVWNQDVRDAVSNRWVDDSVIARQASVFNACCRVFAPRYRAASSKAFTNPVGFTKSFALAYSDVERAFDWYLAHENHGRPFIIAGHSQGAFHIATLLEKRIDGTPLQRQMVAAYIIGINLAEGEFGRRFKHLGICAKAAQTGCVLQWNSVLAGSDIALAAKRSQQAFVDKFGDVPGKATVCINPLTFDQRRPAAAASASLGALPGMPGFGAVRALRPGLVAAHCDQGELVVEPAKELQLEPLPGGSMHYHDYGLFYANIRANALGRVRTFMRHRRANP